MDYIKYVKQFIMKDFLMKNEDEIKELKKKVFTTFNKNKVKEEHKDDISKLLSLSEVKDYQENCYINKLGTEKENKGE